MSRLSIDFISPRTLCYANAGKPSLRDTGHAYVGLLAVG